MLVKITGVTQQELWKLKKKKKAQPLPLHSCTSRNLSFLVLKKIHSPELPEYHRQRNQHIDYDPSWCISIRCINSAPASWKDNCYMLAESQHTAELPLWLRWLRICLQCRSCGFNPQEGGMPWRKKWQPTPVSLPRESLAGYSPWGHKELDMT